MGPTLFVMWLDLPTFVVPLLKVEQEARSRVGRGFWTKFARLPSSYTG